MEEKSCLFEQIFDMAVVVPLVVEIECGNFPMMMQ
jgi:hypothetical protein